MLFAIGIANAQVAEKPEDISPILIGEQVPNVDLKDQNSNIISIADLPDKTVLLFYRGAFCPFCTRHLSDVRTVLPYLKEKGYKVAGISFDSPETNLEKSTQYELDYLLSDYTGDFIRKMGLAFKAPDGYINILKKSSAGKNEQVLPAPALYIVENGKVLFSYVSVDYKTRISSWLLKAVVADIN